MTFEAFKNVIFQLFVFKMHAPGERQHLNPKAVHVNMDIWNSLIKDRIVIGIQDNS